MWGVSKDFTRSGSQRIFFLDACVCFMTEYFPRVMHLLQPQWFEKIFLTYSPNVDYPISYARITNKKYIRYC